VLDRLLSWGISKNYPSVFFSTSCRYLFIVSDGATFKVMQFNPKGSSNSQALPALLLLHGGGYAMTYASTHIHSADFYAQKLNCRVFLVDYRLSLPNPFPDGFNDCYSTLEWMVEKAENLGIDPSRIAAMGDSAGGGLAAGVAQRAVDEDKIKLCGQVLIYPTLDSSCSTRSATEYIDTPLWNTFNNQGMWKTYLRNFSSQKAPAYSAPGDREDLSQLPPTFIETAEFDPLCDEGKNYASRLQQTEVTVEYNQTLNTMHGYDTVLTSEITQQSIQKRLAFMQRFFKLT